MLAATDEELVKTYFARLLLKDCGGEGLRGGTRGQRESTLARGRDLTRDDERVLYSKYLFSLACCTILSSWHPPSRASQSILISTREQSLYGLRVRHHLHSSSYPRPNSPNLRYLQHVAQDLCNRHSVLLAHLYQLSDAI